MLLAKVAFIFQPGTVSQLGWPAISSTNIGFIFHHFECCGSNETSLAFWRSQKNKINLCCCCHPPGAFAKVKESQRMTDEGKMDQGEADGIRKRCRTVGFALQAEMNHFHRQREVDFKDMMQAYLREQIAFYQRVVQQLERTVRMYECL